MFLDMFFHAKPYVRKQIVISICLNIGQIIIGYCVGWSAPMIPLLQDLRTSPLPTVVTETQASLIGSCFLLGSVTGCLLSNLANLIGRKSTIMLGGGLAIISSIILTAAKSFCAIIIGRLIFGVSITIIASINLTYIGEIASTDLRGFILASTAMFHSLGVLLAYSVGSFVSFSEMGYVGIILGVLHVAAILSIPESPIYFALQDDEEAIKKSLDQLGRIKDLGDILNFTRTQSTKNIGTKSALIDLFSIKNNRKAIVITVVLSSFQFGGGILPVSFFATTIFKSAGSSIEPSISTIIIGVTAFFGALVTPMFIEKLGRRVLLITSCAICSTFLAVLGFYFYLVKISSPLVPTLGWLPLASLVISIFGYGVGLNSIPNTLLGELLSPKVRSIGSFITFAISSITGFAVSSCFGYMVSALGSHGTFWIFSFINAAALFFTVVWVPETKGKTLLEIETMLKS